MMTLATTARRASLSGTYCPAPREWCSTLRRCLDPNNPDTPCKTAAPSPYSTTTTRTAEYIRPESREEVRSGEQAAEDLAVLAQRKLDALGIDCDNCCRSYRTCPLGLQCYNDVSCNYGGTENDAGAIMSSHDIFLVEDARRRGIVVERFPATTSGSPTGSYEVLEQVAEVVEQASQPAAPQPAADDPEYLGPGPLPPPLEDAFVGTESGQVTLGGFFSDIPQWAFLAAAGTVALLVLRK